ncbi:hypothetical protein ACFDR9_003410 [Janthinobacterium sp. CG_23.3]|uniref:head GIN domain-containing protein n=1 Tax=Janthinobacterium sp. CG_23.3 TaxID=3349634 RepID=UPI0038D436BC
MQTSITGGGARRLVLAAGAVALCAAAAPAAAWDWPARQLGGKGNGSVHQQARSVGHFDGVALSVPADVELRLGASESVSVETDDNLQALVETTVENGTLKIRVARHGVNLAPSVLRIVVQAPQVERVSLAGSGTLYAAELRAPQLRFEVGGSGSIKVKQVRSEAVSVSIGGSGNFTAGGSTGQLTVAIGGSGSVQTGQLNARAVQASIGGSGKAVVWPRQSLAASIGGSGGIDYYGDPQVSRSVHGSGDVRRLGAAPSQGDAAQGRR